MRKIDMETWPRRQHFQFFNHFDYPHAGLCANVDITAFYPFVKEGGHSFTVATTYLLARAANAVPEFRQRIRGEEVVEHDVVHPSPTFLTDDGLFSFCTIPYSDDFRLFAERAAEQIAAVKAQRVLENEPGQDELLYMTSMPWVSFTSLLHPIHMHPVDSVPRIAWGKFFQDGEILKMPLAVQGHHALMDGVHMGRYYALVEEYLSQPAAVLGE